MFKYLCDKNDIIKSYTGMKGIYERIKFKFEKRNLVDTFIKDIDIDAYALLDFINMVQNYSPNKAFPILLQFNKYSLLYNTFMHRDMVMLEIKTIENDHTHFKISIKIYLDSGDTNIIVSNNKGNSWYNKYPSNIDDDGYENVLMLKKYMLYLLESIINGGEFIEQTIN